MIDSSLVSSPSMSDRSDKSENILSDRSEKSVKFFENFEHLKHADEIESVTGLIEESPVEIPRKRNNRLQRMHSTPALPILKTGERRDREKDDHLLRGSMRNMITMMSDQQRQQQINHEEIKRKLTQRINRIENELAQQRHLITSGLF